MVTKKAQKQRTLFLRSDHSIARVEISDSTLKVRAAYGQYPILRTESAFGVDLRLDSLGKGAIESEPDSSMMVNSMGFSASFMLADDKKNLSDIFGIIRKNRQSSMAALGLALGVAMAGLRDTSPPNRDNALLLPRLERTAEDIIKSGKLYPRFSLMGLVLSTGI